jgi:hypothetical protein
MVRRSVFGLIVAGLFFTSSAQAQVTASAELTTKSRYLFAGMVFWKGPMTQPKLTVSATSGNGTLTVNGGTVYIHGDFSEVMELDLWGDYYYQVNDRVGAYVGAGYYNFKDYLKPGEYAGSPELYGGLVFYLPLTPSVYVAREFELTEGTHVTFSLSHAVPVSDGGLSLNFEGRLDYNHEYYFDDSGFSFADLSGKLNIPAGPFTLSPLVALQVGIADEAYFGDWGLFGLTASAAF